jgi:hypothetical protein
VLAALGSGSNWAFSFVFCRKLKRRTSRNADPVESNEQAHSSKTLAEIPLGFHHINQNTVDRCERLARNEEQGLLILPTQR